MTKGRTSKFKIVFSMVIFGTLGLFVRNIALSSSIISLSRGICGVIFLFIVMAIKRTKLSRTAICNNLFWLCTSGAALGFNWVFLFESYRHTTVATSTLCYYMAPMLIILVSPLVLKERLAARKLLCVIAALIGMVCISGVLDHDLPAAGELKGILFGLAAAVFYACVVLVNKQMKEITTYERTIVQLGISAVVMFLYCLFTESASSVSLTPRSVVMLLIVGVVHTGFAYVLYFGAMECVPAQTAAIVSYIDPVVALLISVTVLGEKLGAVGWIGAALILGAALISESNIGKRSQVQ